jgi:hypothetical protein
LLRALLTLLRAQVRRGGATPGTPRDAPPPSAAEQAALRELAGAQAALRRDLAAALHAMREQAAAHDRELRRSEQQAGAHALRLRTRMHCCCADARLSQQRTRRASCSRNCPPSRRLCGASLRTRKHASRR